MTEAALAGQGRGPTVSLMTRRASAPPSQSPSLPAEATNASSDAASTAVPAKPRSFSSGSSSSNAANSENASADSNVARPAAGGSSADQARAGGAGGNPTIHQNHPADACRYPNKRCYNKRAMKNNGELHKFCDAHRDSANRYQRRLEQRLKEKRIQSRLRTMQAQQAQAQVQAQAQAQAQAQLQAQVRAQAQAQARVQAQLEAAQSAAIGASNPMLRDHFPGMEVYGMPVPQLPTDVVTPVSGPLVHQVQGHTQVPPPGGSTPTGLWSQQENEYEPFQHPVPLQSEDLDCLYLLFHEP